MIEGQRTEPRGVAMASGRAGWGRSGVLGEESMAILVGNVSVADRF